MTQYWPLLCLAAPLAATLWRARSAVLWLSLAAGLLVVRGILDFVTNSWAMGGGTGWPFATLLRGGPLSTGHDLTFHDTYYVVTHLGWLGGLFIPSLVIGMLLCIPSHPRRTRIDIALIWGVVALTQIAVYFPALYFNNGGMPRRYADYPDTFIVVNQIATVAATLAVLVLVIAALRPILSWWQNRRPT